MPDNPVGGRTPGDTGSGGGRAGPGPVPRDQTGPNTTVSVLRDHVRRSQERVRKLTEEFANDEGGTFVPGPGYGLPAEPDPGGGGRRRR